MNNHKCPNCGAVVRKAFELCEKCKKAARRLDHNLSDDLQQEDKPQYVTKNEPMKWDAK